MTKNDEKAFRKAINLAIILIVTEKQEESGDQPDESSAEIRAKLQDMGLNPDDVLKTVRNGLAILKENGELP